MTRARKKCRVNTSRRRVLLPTSLSALVTSLSALSQNKARFWLFYLFYNIALLIFVKKLAFNCKKSSFFFHSLQARARKVFSLPARAEWCHGLPVHLYSDKARCFNQSERALYRNFIIINYITGLFVLSCISTFNSTSNYNIKRFPYGIVLHII